MLIFGVNFSCYYLILLGRLKNVWRDEELRLYIGIILASVAMITWNTYGFFGTFGETLRHSVFQVSSIITTTGFATTDFDLWPTFSKTILVCLMAIGACAGSTGGGFKCSRLLLLFKTVRRNIRQVLHPNRVEVIRINGQAVDERVISNTTAYLAIYVLIFAFSLLILALDQLSFASSFTAVMSCFNNIGPGLEQVGPTCNFGHLNVASKMILCLDMLAGRLEIFPILILFSRNTWKVRSKRRKG
jgi:trk system potassium uptake protein TrkH